MTLAHRNFASTLLQPGTVPAWAARLVSGGDERVLSPHLTIQQTHEFCLARANLPGAAKLSAEDFQQRTTELYLAILKAFADSDAPHPVRFWNYLPGIHAPTGAKIDRYMTFNAGRFAAFEKSFGGRDAMSRSIPSASAVGHHGQDLTIHALSCATPGRPVANPRQVAPYHYSKRFGPLPPCFARATVIETPTPMILVGGTASIRGEDSVHLGKLACQAHETFENLAWLIAHACEANLDAPIDQKLWLNRFRELRVYYMRDEDRPAIETMVGEAFAQLTKAEFIRADLCRAELLVEIEGVAEA